MPACRQIGHLPHRLICAVRCLLAKTATFLGITGTLQAQQGVVHLVAEQLWTPQVGREPASPSSRDVH